MKGCCRLRFAAEGAKGEQSKGGIVAAGRAPRTARRLRHPSAGVGERVRLARGLGRPAMATRGGRLREPWYVAYKSHGGTSMRIFKSKRLAIKVAAEILRD